MTTRLLFVTNNGMGFEIFGHTIKVNGNLVPVMFLFAVFVIGKTWFWWWLLKPLWVRPSITRHNLSLGLIDLGAMLALFVGVIILACQGGWGFWKAAGIGIILLGYNALLRFVMMRVEVRRLMSRSSRRSYTDARREVLLRTRVTFFQ